MDKDTTNSTRDGLVFFDRLADEQAEEAVPSGSGVFSNLFGRFWKSEGTPNPETSTFYTNANTTTTASPFTIGDSEIPPPTPKTTSGEVRNDLAELSITTNGNSGVRDHGQGSSSNGTPIHSGSAGLQQGMSPSQSSQNSFDSDTVPPRKVSGRLSRLFKSGNKQGLMDYNRSNFRQYWMPDSTGRECYQCEERFTAFRRRHHCRLCGQIFCAKCCNVHVPGSALGYIGDLRLCHYCAKMMAIHLPPEADLRTSSEDLSTSSNNASGLTSSSFAQQEEAEGDMLTQAPVIATVSAGSLMWSNPSELATPTRSRKNSVSTPTSGPQKPPTMLCVQDLYLQHEQQSQRAGRARSNTGCSLTEEDESGPDWFRNMDASANIINGVHKDDSTKSLESAVEAVSALAEQMSVASPFEPLPIDEQDEERGKEERKEEEKEKNPLEKLPGPLSPTKSLDVSGQQRLDDDIDKSFEKGAERMLTGLFHREQLDETRWKDIIVKLARKVSETVKVDVARRRDSMNILSYVHIKKLVVDQEQPTAETIWGVVCSKSVAHVEMAGELRDASVMIVAGSIEYERVQGKLSSIEPIICQEAEFLSKQVERILSRRPSLLLVEGVVSRLASELLRKAGVRLVVNVRPRVLHRVGRSTGADLLPSSDAQLIQQNIGYCPSFRQQMIKLKNGTEKLLLMFDECAAERGCSILLRGNNLRELRSVKRVLQMMISLLYSARLEKAYLNLFGTRLAYQISDCDVCEARRQNIDKQTEKSEFEQALSNACLSTSAFIEYEPPFLETSKGKNCSLLPYFKQPLYRFSTKEEFVQIKEDEEETIRKKDEAEKKVCFPNEPRHPFSKSKCREDTEYDQDALASFRAIGGKLFRKRLQTRETKMVASKQTSLGDKARRQDVLDPWVHQRVAVLFGSFSPKSPNAPYFCVRPWVVSMEFYADHDMTLGEFLTKYCFNKSYECPSSNCEIPMLDHSRKMVYGRVCVEVTTQMVVQASNSDEAPSAATSGQILTWHYCPTCKVSSPVVTLGSAVWHLSFGKYLDYIANSAYATGCVSNAALQHCNHCFFHHQTHFYSQNNFVTTFKVTPIRPFNVQFSSVKCKVQPQQFSRQALLDGVVRMAALADDIANTANERLQIFEKNEHYAQYAGTFHTVLKQLVEKTVQLVNARRAYADELKTVERVVIASNEVTAVKSNETMMYIREAIWQLINTWNDQCTVLAATMRAMKKSSEENGAGTEFPDISLERIDDPFPTYLHLGLKLQPRVGVVVRDIQDSRGNYKPDIGSIIAYALSSANYDELRRKKREACGGEEPPLNLNSSSMAGDEASINAEHLEIEFQDNQATYYVKAFYADRFRLLRDLLFVDGEEAFIRSLSQSTFWTPQGGKSGSFFYRTQDDRFIVKQMSRFEIQSFVKFAPNYFEYIKTAAKENKLTTLCKVYGVFKVGYKSKTTQLKVDILVMEYLFYKHNVDQVWDLKGSLRNRMASTGKSSSDLVLLDENLMKDLWNKQLYVYPHSKAALNQAISNDSHFLSAQDVMDYSLLVGVDETNGELVLGIVDYMRTYTLDKKLESWVKIVAIPGAHLPTILSPEMYCTRFSEAIDTYFPVVPDQWTGLGSAVSY